MWTYLTFDVVKDCRIDDRSGRTLLHLQGRLSDVVKDC